MQTLDSLYRVRRANKVHALTLLHLPQIYVKYLRFIGITTSGTEGALPRIFFFKSQNVTNSHLAACWNSLSQKRKEKAMLFSAFVLLKDPLPP